MPDFEEEESYAHQRSTLAALGSRRPLFSFGNLFSFGRQPDESSSNGDSAPGHRMLEGLDADALSHARNPAAPSRPATGADEDPLPGHRMLEGLDGYALSLARNAAAPSRPATGADEDPLPGHRMLEGLDGYALPDARNAAAPSRVAAEAAEEPRPASVAAGRQPRAPFVAHSTLGELAGLEEPSPSSFPIERAILISLLAHLCILILLIVLPARTPSDSKGDLFAALLKPQPKDDTPIPVIFQEAPGPSRPNPKRSPLSDADRRAGGGDASRPKSNSPFVPPSKGIAGLSPGPRSPRVPGSAVPARKGATAEAERKTAAAEAQSEPRSNPSEFPTSSRRETSLGPRESTRLAGLDSAIREAARGTVGGEGGAPEGNPGGGFVDSGPISFDTTWYDWGAYAAEMVRRIKLHWDVPELARLGWKGKLTVRFFILADGRVAEAKIIRTSGIPPFDFAAFQAITKSSPFRPLPTELHEDREGVTVTFFYNLRPESEEAGGTR